MILLKSLWSRIKMNTKSVLDLYELEEHSTGFDTRTTLPYTFIHVKGLDGFECYVCANCEGIENGRMVNLSFEFFDHVEWNFMEMGYKKGLFEKLATFSFNRFIELYKTETRLKLIQ